MLKSIVPALVCGLMLVGTVAGGLIQRQYGDGGAHAKSLERAAAKLNLKLPERIGNWRLLQQAKLEPDVVRMLRCPAYVNRVYVHDQTGDRMGVAVLLGPPGPIAAHTPEICYSSQDYSVGDERIIAKLADQQGAEHSFWEVGFTSNNVSKSQLRVLYAWSTGMKWEAADDPRFKYAGSPYLYKIQLAGPIAGDPTQFDPCQDFLTQFLSQLRPQMVAVDPA